MGTADVFLGGGGVGVTLWWTSIPGWAPTVSALGSCAPLTLLIFYYFLISFLNFVTLTATNLLTNSCDVFLLNETLLQKFCIALSISFDFTIKLNNWIFVNLYFSSACTVTTCITSELVWLSCNHMIVFSKDIFSQVLYIFLQANKVN